MRLKKRDLAKKLGVSEKTLSSWQAEGMPVLEHGRRGQPNSYDLAAVVRWIGQTGRAFHARTHMPVVDLCGLERELQALQAPNSPQPAAPPKFPDPHTIRAMDEARAASVVEAAAWMAHLFKLNVPTAIRCVLIVFHEECSAFEDVNGFGSGPTRAWGDYGLADDYRTLPTVIGKVDDRLAQLEAGVLGVYESFFFDDDGNPL